MLIKSLAQLGRRAVLDHLGQAFLHKLLLTIVGIAQAFLKQVVGSFNLHLQHLQLLIRSCFVAVQSGIATPNYTQMPSARKGFFLIQDSEFQTLLNSEMTSMRPTMCSLK